LLRQYWMPQIGCFSGWLRFLRLGRRDCERIARLQLGVQSARSPRLPAL